MAGSNKKIKGCGFHHISMHVRNLAKSKKFYEELGFVVKYSWGEAPKKTVLMDTGDGNYFEMSQGDPEAEYPEGVLRHIALRTDDVMSAVELARGAGAEVTMETRDVYLSSEPPIPIRIAFFKGPDGEVIELFHDEET